MPLEKGSLVLVDYTARVKDTNEVFETTREDEAKKTNQYDPTRKYEPRLVSVGESWVLKGLDEALAKASVGDRLNVEVTPDKGFGDSDRDKVSALVRRRMGLDDAKVKVNLAAPNLDIELPEEAFLAEGLQVIKRAVANDIFKFVISIKNIRFVENYS